MSSVKVKKENPGIAKAIAVAGSQVNLAEMLDCTQPNVFRWLYHQVPAERAVQIEKVTGVSRRLMRPDLFR